MAEFDVVVVGSGAGGMTTAVVCAKHGLKVLVVETAAPRPIPEVWPGSPTIIT